MSEPDSTITTTDITTNTNTNTYSTNTNTNTTSTTTTNSNDLVQNEEQAYIVAHCPILGRHLIAAKDLDIGDIILEEKPIAAAPERGSELICPGCYKNNPQANCDLCNWPICGSNCPGLDAHQQTECLLLLSKSKACPRDKSFWSLASDCLITVRCLDLKEKQPNKWEQLLSMETNWEAWSSSPLLDRAIQLKKILRELFDVPLEKFPDLEILQIQAILDINAYEVRMPQVNIQASFKLAALAEHNCRPNGHRIIKSDTLDLSLIAAVPIKKGEHITASYCDMLWTTEERKKFLQYSKFFVCQCERCKDPTELGSYLSALLCPNCICKPIVPVLGENGQKYQCQEGCQFFFDPEIIKERVKIAGDELQELDKDQTIEKLSDFEDWIRRWSPSIALKNQENPPDLNKNTTNQLLYSQNSLVLDCCHTIFLLIDSNDDSTSKEKMERKVFLGNHLLNSTRNIMSGISKFRGTILNECGMTRIAIFMRDIEESDESESVDEEAKQFATESLRIVQESIEMLKYEPELSPEAILCKSSSNQYDQIKMFFEFLFDDQGE